MPDTIHRILVPTDFSPTARAALRYAKMLRAKFDSEMILVHVMQDLSLLVPDAMPAMSAIVPDVTPLLTQARESLRTLISDEALPADRTRGEVIVGSPSAEIVTFAVDQHVDLIVMGTHGRTGLAHLFLGSVAEKVVRHAPCAVLTIRS